MQRGSYQTRQQEAVTELFEQMQAQCLTAEEAYRLLLDKGMDVGKTTVYRAITKLCEQGILGENDTVVSVVTGNGLKDVANAIKACGEPISIPNDMELLLKAFAEKDISVD